MRADGLGLQGARRVLVYGVTGSGKTTLAERLSRELGIDWVSVDDLTWQPGWVLPRWRSRGRLLRRTVGRNLGRKHERIVRWETDPAMPPVLRIRRPDQLEAWLSSVQREIREAA